MQKFSNLIMIAAIFIKRTMLAEPMGLLSLLLIIFVIGVAIFAPYIVTHDPLEIDVVNKLAEPSQENYFGTDNLGRDIFSRVIYGTRIALYVSLLSISVGFILALVFGIISGYYPGRIGNFILVILDIIKSFPSLLLAITIIALTSPNMSILIIVISITRFPAYARLVRAQTLKIKEKDFVFASKALGTPALLIILKHILPNILGPVFIQIAMDIPAVITFEAGLSFIGVGVPPPTPSWGSILREGYLSIRLSPWQVVFSGLFLMIATVAFTLMGETLRDSLDPKLRKKI